MSVAVGTATHRRAHRAGVRRLAAEQAGVAGAQIAAGLGNAAFVLIAARILAPGAFAQVAAFLALYLLVHVPASSLSAGSALDGALAGRLRRRVVAGGLGIAAVVAVASPVVAPLLGLPVALVLVLAAGVPAAMPLALERGRLFGAGRHGPAAASLVVEPAARLALGLPLAAIAGPAGAAAGVIAGGWAALAVAHAGAPQAHRAPVDPVRAAVGTTGAAVAAFLGLALVQNQDVLLANALLTDLDAGRFAVLSTLGGIAAFATTTIPLVLLPRARDGHGRALAAALGVAALLGFGAVGIVAIAPRAIVTTAFGARFAGVSGTVAPYLSAMALLGMARVLVAQRAARGAGWALAVRVGVVAAIHAGLILAFARTPGAVAACTLGATALLLIAAAPGAVVLRLPVATRPERTAGAGPAPARRRLPAVPIVVVLITLGALVLRLWATRSLWLDEATTVSQAQLSLPGMLHDLGTTDVHPPLHHFSVWVMVHLFGTGQLVVRVPSIVAGTLLIPALWATGRELWGPRAGLAAAVLGAVAPFAVWYAQEARMYAFFMLFATLALLVQLRAMRTGQKRWWVALAVAGAALIWTQYFAGFVAVVLHAGTALELLAARRRGEAVRGRALGWLGALVLTALLVAPLVHFALGQFDANEAAGRGFDQSPSQAGGGVGGSRQGPGVYSALTNIVWSIWGYHSNATMAALTALWPALMLGMLLLLGRGRLRHSAMVVAVAFLPMAGMTVLGVAKPFLFEPRYFIALTPMVLLLLARATTAWPGSRTGAVLCTGALAATLAAGTADQQLNRSNPRLYDFKGAIARIRHEARPGDVVLYQPSYLDDLVRYLKPGVPARPLQAGIPRRRSGRVFVLASFQDQPSAANATAQGLDALKRSGRHQTEFFRKPQVKVWVYR